MSPTHHCARCALPLHPHEIAPDGSCLLCGTDTGEPSDAAEFVATVAASVALIMGTVAALSFLAL